MRIVVRRIIFSSLYNLLALLLLVVVAKATGGSDGGDRRGRISFSFLAPLPFSKKIAIETPPPKVPLTFFRKFMRPHHYRYHNRFLFAPLSTSMSILGGHAADVSDGDGRGRKEQTTATNDFDSSAESGKVPVGENVDEEAAGPTETVEHGEKKIVAVHTYHHQNHGHENALTNDAAADDGDAIDDKNLTLMGVGMSRQQFAAWVHYYLSHMMIECETSTKTTTVRNEQPGVGVEDRERVLVPNRILQNITTQEFDWDSEWEDGEGERANEAETARLKIRQFWSEGKLICEHTNLLLSSDLCGNGRNRRRRRKVQEVPGGDDDNPSKAVDEINIDVKREEEEEDRRYRQEKFRNTLKSYADRLVSIVEDELTDNNYDIGTYVNDNGDREKEVMNTTATTEQRQMHQRIWQDAQHQYSVALPKWTTPKRLLGWIENEYGVENTRHLMADTLLQKSEREQLEVRSQT